MVLFMSFTISDNFDQIGDAIGQFENKATFSTRENFPCWDDWDDPAGEPVTFRQCKEPRDTNWCTQLFDKFPKGNPDNTCSKGVG